MSGLFQALGSATAGLRTVQTNLRLVSDNVARADDPSRTRHDLEKVTDFSGRIVGVNFDRRMDQILSSQYNEAIARDGAGQARDRYFTRIGDAFTTSTGTPVLADAAQKFMEAWQTLESTPESETAAFQVVSLGDNFASQLRSASEEVERIDRDLRTEITDSVGELNRQLNEIHSLNIDISTLQINGDEVNELRDRRDQRVRELSELMPVRSMENSEGVLRIFTSSGMALLDNQPVQFQFVENRIELTSQAGVDQRSHLGEGKLGALVDFVADGSTATPPRAASPGATTEVMRKLRSQLDAVAKAFTSPTAPGQPTSFADAYDNAQPVEAGELDRRFFSGKDRFSLTVDDQLLKGTLKVKQSALADVTRAVTVTGRSFTADGFSVTDTGYNGMISGVLGGWSNAASKVQESADLNSETRSLIETRFHGAVGVNIDEEIATLQSLQTSYQASARVIQVAQRMLDALEGAIQ